jgi:predicted transposase YdaD
VEDATAKGKAEGIAIGEERGELKKAKETALSMLVDGLPVETISKYTGLSVHEVEALEKHH